MWQLLVQCMSQRRVAVCIPWKGQAVPLIYWYGVLASIGIALGAFYASKHLELEGDDPDIVWDALLWVLIPALVGARVWYVLQDMIFNANQWTLLQAINLRQGGLNIFGGALFGLVALFIYVKLRKVNGWLLADGALMGLLIGQGIGRFGNLVNLELYGPPTTLPWGIKIPAEYRLPQFASLPDTTRFHPTMMYEAIWLFLGFGILFYLFLRFQERFIQGIPTGLYLIWAGVGRFIMEFWRPDQPGLTLQSGVTFSFSRIMAVFYVILGIIIVLDRLDYVRIPFIPRPQTPRQRAQAYSELVRERDRQERARERERMREMRRKERARRREEGDTEDDNGETSEEAAETG